MGAPPYLVAATLIGVVAQRLARRLCSYCAVDSAADPVEMSELGLPARGNVMYLPRGCTRCEGHGFKGRVGIFEILTMTTSLRDIVTKRGSADALREAARADGVASLGVDAWRKVRAGLTSLAEVRPLLRTLADDAHGCTGCGCPLRSTFAACPSCGRRLRVRCACGALIQKGWRFCAECGAAQASTLPALQ
jgi:hypothetical protein